ncbi:hypothetical protein ABH920_000556 [Catenulispora sp. EB89]|uniref:hypothetical protein n=1 Tax=Catenulispora sp. EB89 TaxID=3156257 RepID=UPI003511DF47
MAQYNLRKPLKAATFHPAKYGLVPDDQVRSDAALADPVLAAALEACRVGDWKPAKAALAAVGKDWDRRGLYVQALGGTTAVGPRWLHSWRAAEPSSPDAAVVFAHSLVVKAWNARGGGYAAVTTRQQFQRFHELLRTGADEAMNAAELAPEDPTPWMTMVTAARGLQLSNSEFERIWQELLIRDSLNRRAHIQALQYWQPKWFGSVAAARSFVEDTAARAPRSAVALQLRLGNELEIWLPTARTIRQTEHFRRGSGRDALRKALGDHWDGTVPTGGGVAVVDGNWLAWALTLANRWDDACKVWLALGGCLVPVSPWLYQADQVVAFIRLRREAFVMSGSKPVA